MKQIRTFCLFLLSVLSFSFILTSCNDTPEEAYYYTAKGDMANAYLLKRPEMFSKFVEIIRFVDRYYEDNGRSPSTREIAGDGWHTVRWEYIKDEMDDEELVGDNVAKLDNVVWRSEDAPPTVTETQTTPVPVPYVWLDPYLAKYGDGDYEAAGKAKGRNGASLWESYVAGLDPEDPTSKFTAVIELLPNGAVKITWSPDLSTAEVPRTYTTLGKATLLDANWTPVTEENKANMRFFKVKVEIK